MALKPCKSCKHQIDVTAKICPSCGVAKPGVSAKDTLIGLVILVIIIVVAAKACGGGSDRKQAAEAAPRAATTVQYAIVKDEQRPNGPRKVEIQLPRRLTNAELAEVSAAVRDATDKPAERTYIGYRVTGQTESTFWASASYEPDFSSRVIGLTADEYQKLASLDFKNYSNALGHWLRDGALGHAMVLYKKGDKYAIDLLFANGGKSTELYTGKTQANGELRLDRPNDFGEYYIVKKDGTLQGWSENGMYLALPKRS